MTTNAKTNDGLAIIERRLSGEPNEERAVIMRAYGLALDVAQTVYDLREASGLSQAEFAIRAGLTVQDIEDLEDADFQGDLVATLHQIASVLGHELKLTVTPKQAA